jgi:hypothetical protein
MAYLPKNIRVQYFDLKSKLWTRQQWLDVCKAGGYHLSEDAETVMARAFNLKFPTEEVHEYSIALVMGSGFPDHERNLRHIAAEAVMMKFKPLSAHLVFLLRLHYSDHELKKMGLEYIIVMHNFLKSDHGEDIPLLFDISVRGEGNRIGAFSKGPDYKLTSNGAYAFWGTKPRTAPTDWI